MEIFLLPVPLTIFISLHFVSNDSSGCIQTTLDELQVISSFQQELKESTEKKFQRAKFGRKISFKSSEHKNGIMMDRNTNLQDHQ